MSTDIIQAHYEQLNAIADRFGQQAETIREMLDRTRRNADVLIKGDWEGNGIDAFSTEMDGTIYPALDRLISAMIQARSVTLEVKEIIWQAEQEAANPFRVNDESSIPLNSNGSQPNEKGGSFWDKWGEWVHSGLDAAGFIPLVGEVADGVNAAIYLAEGRYAEAAISAAAMVPIVGDAGKVGKWGVKAGKEVIEAGAERTAKEAAEGVVRSTDYSKLRQKTPTQKIRDSVNPPGPKRDPIYGFNVDKLEADHIVPMKDIVDMPGFDRLTEAQKVEVLNLRENFVGLSKSSNSSKGAKSWSAWEGHSRHGPIPPDVRKEMLKREERARQALQDAINERLP